MGIEFNPVSEVKNQTFVSRIGKSLQEGFGQIFSTKTSNYGLGVTLENPRLAKLEEHFKDVPAFEYNNFQTNLKIKDDLMGVAGVDY